MKKITEFARLLGEDNEKRFKDAITDKLISYVEEDIRDMGFYLIDFDGLFDEVKKDLQKEFKERVYAYYIGKLEEKFTELVGELSKNGN